MTTRKIIDVLGISAPTDTGRWRATQESMMRARYRRGEINGLSMKTTISEAQMREIDEIMASEA